MEESNFNNFEGQQKLPNGTAVLVLGILSVITCCCYGILGIVLGGIGLYLAKKDTDIYNSNPSVYNNFNNIKTGKILCIIGIALSVLYLIYMIWAISYFGLEALQDPDLMQEKIRDLMGE